MNLDRPMTEYHLAMHVELCQRMEAAALRAERDALQVHLRAAEEAAGHSEFLSSPLYSTIAKIVAERDAAQAEAARLTSCLKAANDQAERFEREWYLRGDEVARLRDALRAALARLEGK